MIEELQTIVVIFLKLKYIQYAVRLRTGNNLSEVAYNVILSPSGVANARARTSIVQNK